MKFALCNEFCQGWEIKRVFELARETGFDGVELAPFTFATDVNDISMAERVHIAEQARQSGIDIVGLHWLLAGPDGLHITHPDESVRRRTAKYFRALIAFCGDVGGSKMVFGSPKQRNVLEGVSQQEAWNYAKDFFTSILPDLERRGIDLCIEPLSRADTNFITTAAEGLKLCQEINHPRFRLHLDVKAMCDEEQPMDEIIKACKGYVAHFHANDANLSYPGSGNTDYAPIARGLKAINYEEWISVEVFDFKPNPETIAAESYSFLSKTFD